MPYLRGRSKKYGVGAFVAHCNSLLSVLRSIAKRSSGVTSLSLAPSILRSLAISTRRETTCALPARSLSYPGEPTRHSQRQGQLHRTRNEPTFQRADLK